MEHAQNMRRVYGKRYRMMLSNIRELLSTYVDFKPPEGGLSFWLSPANGYWHNRTEELYSAILSQKVIVTPGSVFSRGNTGHFRVSFAAAPEERIAEGIRIIGSILQRQVQHGK